MRCSAILVLEAIMAACHKDSDPNARVRSERNCFAFWAGTTEGSVIGQPVKAALTFETWSHWKENPTCVIRYGLFLLTIEAAHHFAAKTYMEAVRQNAGQRFLDKLANLEVTFLNRRGEQEKQRLSYFFEWTGDRLKLDKVKIIHLSRHSSGVTSGGIEVYIYSQESDLSVARSGSDPARKHYFMRRGCTQIFMGAETGNISQRSAPRELVDGGAAVTISEEELWEFLVLTGAEELIPANIQSRGENIEEFVFKSETRIERIQALRRHWGLLADVAGRIVGSARRFFQAITAMLALVGHDFTARVYPGWFRNQLNAVATGSLLLRSVLFRDTFILWPVFGILASSFAIPAFMLFGADPVAILTAFVGALALSSAGSRPCAATVSYAGTGFGGWAFSAFFAISQACVTIAGIGNIISPDLSKRIVGGLVGSNANLLFQSSRVLFIIALLCSSFAISLAAWGMRGPNRLDSPKPGKKSWRTIGFFVLGTFPGAFIGVCLLLPKLLGGGPMAVCLVIGFVAGTAFLCSAIISRGNGPEAWKHASVHGLFVALLALGAYLFDKGFLGVIIGCAATGILHGSIFTLVFLLTRKLTSSSLLGAIAATVEGVGGFVGFAISQVSFSSTGIPIGDGPVFNTPSESPGVAMSRLSGLAFLVVFLWPLLIALFWKIRFVRVLPGTKTMDTVGQIGLCLIITSVFASLSSILLFDQLWIHRFGGALLGLFLLSSLVLQVFLWKAQRDRSIEKIRKATWTWRLLTEVMPAPAAIILFSTGLSRVFSVNAYSIANMWVFLLVLLLGAMMADGIFGYTPGIRALAHAARTSSDTDSFIQATRDPFRDLKFVLHAVSFPFVVLLPIFKFGQGSGPVLEVFRLFGFDPYPGGWKQVGEALMLFAGVFGTVAILNLRSPLNRRFLQARLPEDGPKFTNVD